MLKHRVFLIFVWFVLFSNLQLRLCSQSDFSGSISGTVISEKGSSVSAFINIFRLISHNGSLVPQNECTKVVDSDGMFNCGFLPPGYYVATVHLLGCPLSKTLNTTPEELCLPCSRLFVYPPNADDDPSSVMYLQRGENLMFNLDVADAPGEDLHVKQAGDRGIDKWHLYWKVGGASIPIEAKSFHETKRTLVFSGLPQTTIRIVENWYLNDTEHEASVVANTTRNDTSELVLLEQPFYSVLGHIKYGVKPTPKVEEIACGEVQEESDLHFSAFIEADGSFLATHVSPGLYNCTLRGPEGLFIKSVSQRNSTASGVLLDLRYGTLVPLDIEAGFSTTRITGVLRGNHRDEVSGAAGIAIRSMDTGATRSLKTNTDGKFEILGLPPGTYRLYGWAEIDKVPYKSSGFLHHYDEKSTQISVEQNTSIPPLEIDCLN